MKEREISLIDFIFEVLLRWRVIVLAMLIGALLLGGFSYVNSWRTFKAQEARIEAAQEQLKAEMQEGKDQIEYIVNENTLDKEIVDYIAKVNQEWLEEELTDQQRYNVNYVMTYEDIYREKVEYVENSVLMQMNPNNVKLAEVTILFSSSELEKTYNIVKMYEDLVKSGEMLDIIAGEIGSDISVVNELVTLEKESYELLGGVDTLRIKVVHSNEKECSNIVEKMIDYLEEKKVDLEAVVGNHELTVLSKSLVTVFDANIMSHQRNYRGDLVNLENTITYTKSNFSEIEWQYYDFLLNGKLTELSISKMVEAVSEEETAEEIVDKGVTVYPGINKIYVILGAIMAAFVVVFLIFVLHIMNGKLRVTDNVQFLYNIPQLGMIYKGEKTDKILGFLDDWIITLRDWNKRKFTRGEAINLSAVAIKMSIEKDALHKVYLIGCDLKKLALETCEQLKSTLEQENVKVEILNNVLYDAKAMGELQNAQGVVLVEKVGSTLYTEITQEIELLNRQEIKILGVVVVE